MKTNGNDKALESYKIFPYVAWGLIIFFTIFVYNITQELKSITENLQIQAANNQVISSPTKPVEADPQS